MVDGSAQLYADYLPVALVALGPVLVCLAQHFVN